MFTLAGKDGVSPCVPDEERACGGGGCLDEMVLKRGWVSAAVSLVSVVGGDSSPRDSVCASRWHCGSTGRYWDHQVDRT